MEDRFKELNDAYDRLQVWIDERDSILEDDLKNNRRPGMQYDEKDGSVTVNLGKLRLEGKVSRLDKQKILLEMGTFSSLQYSIVQEDLDWKEPKNIKAYLLIAWAFFGFLAFRSDWKLYKERMIKPKDGVDYDSYFNGYLGRKFLD
jgi:hypothetical protein